MHKGNSELCEFFLINAYLLVFHDTDILATFEVSLSGIKNIKIYVVSTFPPTSIDVVSSINKNGLIIIFSNLTYICKYFF